MPGLPSRSDGRAGDREPEDAVADLDGVVDAERYRDVAEDDFYVNDVVVDLEADISSEELTAVLELLDAYEDEEEPVGAVLYLDGGTTALEAPGQGGLDGIWTTRDADSETLSPPEQAELFLAGTEVVAELAERDDLDDLDPRVTLQGAGLQILTEGELDSGLLLRGEDDGKASLVAAAAEVASANDVVAGAQVTVLAGSHTLFSATGLDEDVLGDWDRTRAALASLGPTASLSQARDEAGVVSTQGCVRTPDRLRRGGFTAARFAADYRGGLSGLRGVLRDQPTGSRLEVAVQLFLGDRRYGCEPFVTSTPQRLELEPGFDRDWRDVLEGS